MKFERVWAMPNKNTFEIKPIKQLIKEESLEPIIDPFPYPYRTDAVQYLRTCSNAGTVLFDPPYSLRQLKELYNNHGLALTQEYTQSYWGLIEKEIDRVLLPGGICIKFGWNSKRISKNFEITRILLVSHGGNHNDTICTVQRKINESLSIWD